MDNRLRPRVELNINATIIDLTTENRWDDCQLVDLSQSGVCVKVQRPVTPRNIVRIDFSEGSLFGQVVHSTGNGPYRTGIEILDVLLGSSTLAQLFRQTLRSCTRGIAESRPAPVL